jgi:hypothetical protein
MKRAKRLLAVGPVGALVGAVAFLMAGAMGVAGPIPAGEASEPGVVAIIDGDPVVKLLPHDAIPAVDDPEMVPASEAGEFMRDDEMVLGVFDGVQARAYSTWHLDRHEIVNDRLGETPIAATW